MPLKKSAKKASASKTSRAAAAAATRHAKKEAAAEVMRQWIAQNDPLLDKAESNPIKLDDIFSTIITRKTFAQPGAGQVPYDWTAFRTAVERRFANSPRWFVQLREEDLLAGEDGMEGVTVNCFVVAETAEPTLAPAEYVVKVHWPYSDAEDNAPERILPIAGQGMCWRRVVKNDGSDVNMYLLQKRTDKASASSATPAATTAASFGFGAPAAAPVATAATSNTSTASATPTSFGFGFGTNATPSAPSSAPPMSFSFGFGQQTAGAPPPPSFGFGAAPSTTATTNTAAAPTTAAPTAFGFGFGTVKSNATSTSPSPAEPPASPVSGGGHAEDGAVKTQPLQTSEVLFCLWSRKRLTSMAHEVKSGSRIVREKFPLDSAHNKMMKLVMENDRKDSVSATARKLILHRLFAKQDSDVMQMDKWINDCPVYDEQLTAALQAFRERNLNEIADESDEFAKLYDAYHQKIETELQRIVDIRESAAKAELEAIEDITQRIKEHKLAEKASYRLLKYYPKNDVQRFRPFGKVSGISEMGETVDLCEPPAHVNINPFTGKPS